MTTQQHIDLHSALCSRVRCLAKLAACRLQLARHVRYVGKRGPAFDLDDWSVTRCDSY